jgi:hypothetical protein
MATRLALVDCFAIGLLLVTCVACAHSPRSSNSRFVLQRHSRSVSFLVPPGWEVSPFRQQDFPSYSGIEFTPVGHRSDTDLSLRLTEADPVDSQGQSAIHAKRLATQREDYPSAASHTVGQVDVANQRVWIQLMESGGYQYYDAVIPLGDQTLSLELLHSAAAGIEQYRRGFEEVTKSCIINSH